jgi:hypothetical protein
MSSSTNSSISLKNSPFKLFPYIYEFSSTLGYAKAKQCTPLYYNKQLKGTLKLKFESIYNYSNIALFIIL